MKKKAAIFEPIKETCQRCDGLGIIFNGMIEYACAECDGSGEVTVMVPKKKISDFAKEAKQRILERSQKKPSVAIDEVELVLDFLRQNQYDKSHFRGAPIFKFEHLFGGDEGRAYNVMIKLELEGKVLNRSHFKQGIPGISRMRALRASSWVLL